MAFLVLESDEADVEDLRRAVHGAITAVQADLEGNLMTCQPTPTAPPWNAWPSPVTLPKSGWRANRRGG